MLDIKPVASLNYNVLNGFNQSHIIFIIILFYYYFYQNNVTT